MREETLEIDLVLLVLGSWRRRMRRRNKEKFKEEKEER